MTKTINWESRGDHKLTADEIAQLKEKYDEALGNMLKERKGTMKAFFGLTSTEADIMEIFWTRTEPMSFKEIMGYMSAVFKKDWKSQTLNTYLSNLKKAGLIQTDRTNYHYLYTAACTKEEYVQRWTRKLVEEAFDNSIINFIVAFTGGGKLSPEDAEKLRKLM